MLGATPSCSVPFPPRPSAADNQPVLLLSTCWAKLPLSHPAPRPTPHTLPGPSSADGASSIPPRASLGTPTAAGETLPPGQSGQKSEHPQPWMRADTEHTAQGLREKPQPWTESRAADARREEAPEGSEKAQPCAQTGPPTRQLRAL